MKTFWAPCYLIKKDFAETIGPKREESSRKQINTHQLIYIETSVRNKCRCSFYCALLTLYVSVPIGGHLQNEHRHLLRTEVSTYIGWYTRNRMHNPMIKIKKKHSPTSPSTGIWAPNDSPSRMVPSSSTRLHTDLPLVTDILTLRASHGFWRLEDCVLQCCHTCALCTCYLPCSATSAH
jgi:hypothetical protein